MAESCCTLGLVDPSVTMVGTPEIGFNQMVSEVTRFGEELVMSGSLVPGGQSRSASKLLEGHGNVGGGKAKVGEVLSGALKWLGNGYKEIKRGVFRSADGSRQFRMKAGDLADPKQGPHVHFEAVGPDGRKIVENSHVRLED